MSRFDKFKILFCLANFLVFVIAVSAESNWAAGIWFFSYPIAFVFVLTVRQPDAAKGEAGK